MSNRMERRFVPTGTGRVEVRASGDDGEKRGIGGTVNSYGAVTDLGPFTEEVAPGFFDDIDQSDVRGLFNHDPNYVLGRTKSGTLSVNPTGDGLDYDIADLPESRADVMEAVERGDVDGNSFSFAMPADGSGEEWLDDESREKPHRVLRKAAAFYDVGPVTFPAYEQGTAVATRSAGDVFAEYRTRVASEPGLPDSTFAQTWQITNVQGVQSTATQDAVNTQLFRLAASGVDVETEEAACEEQDTDAIELAATAIALEGEKGA